MQDSKTLHFLKHFPAWLVLTLLFLVVLWFYLRTNDQFLQRIVDTILGGLMVIFTGRIIQPSQSANTATGDVIVAPTNDLQNLTDTEISGAVENFGGTKVDGNLP